MNSTPPHSRWIWSFHPFLGRPILLIPLDFTAVLVWVSCLCLSSLPYALHAPPTWFFSILSPEQFWVWSTDQEAPHLHVSYISKNADSYRVFLDTNVILFIKIKRNFRKFYWFISDYILCVVRCLCLRKYSEVHIKCDVNLSSSSSNYSICFWNY